MRNSISIIIILIIISLLTTIKAQSISTSPKCYSHEILQQHIAEHPELRARVADLEHQTALYTAQNQVKTRNSQITIPVVVHIVYRTAAENISTEQVQSQIDALNRDFNKKNTDVAKVPSEFLNLAADCQIKFQLASRDPKAQPTTGIVRYATTKTKWGSSDNIKYPEKGGFANWNSSKYLNIYVCNIGDGILGYASFPGVPANLDGVVVDYTAFGTTGTVHEPYTNGRTCVHEVGHWMNLLHVWGDGECGDDHVADTPQQKAAHYGDVTTPQYSTCTGTKTRDMSMNFMDYVNDNDMFMFTQGQKERIQATFGTIRASFLTSDGCSIVKPNNCKITKPIVSNIKSTTANINWIEILGMKKYTIEYRIDSAKDWTISQTANLSFTIGDLVGGATYHARVKGDCDEVTYSDEVTFTTFKNSVAPSKLSENKTFAIYPNPVVHDVNIMFDVRNDGLVKVQIFDSNGVLRTQVDKNVTKTTPAVSLDLTEYPSGFYLVVAEQDGQRAVKKLLKVNQ